MGLVGRWGLKQVGWVEMTAVLEENLEKKHQHVGGGDGGSGLGMSRKR